MIIKFDTNIFHYNENELDLSYFISNLTNNLKHEIFVEFKDIQGSVLYEKLSNTVKELIEHSFNNIISKSKSEDYLISQTNKSDNSLNFDEAKIFFQQPFLIILENNLNDGHFIDSLIKAFGNKKIVKHKDKCWLIYENGGGCTNMINCIEAIKNRFNNLPKSNENYLRCFVIVDCDKKYPLEPNKDDKNTLFRYLEENNINYHQLYKRKIENYLPLAIFEGYYQNQKYISILKGFKSDMLDFFNIEKGFNNIHRNKLSQEEKGLYENVSDSDFSFLKSKNFKKQNFKSEVPKLFSQVTKEMFEENSKHQTNPNELEDLLKAITKEL